MNAQNWIFLFVIIASYIAGVAESQCPGYFKGFPSVEADYDSDSDSDSDGNAYSTEDCSVEMYEIVQPSTINKQIAEDPAACRANEIMQCDVLSPYRTPDGRCNNLNHPTWGMSNDCFLRFQPAFYNGYDGFRESMMGGPLPEPRDLTLNIFKNEGKPSKNLTFMLSIYGQMVAHDLSRVQFLPADGDDCCLPINNGNPNCLQISIRPDDPFYSQFNVTCLDLKRSKFCTICKTTHREQMNTVTGMLDLSTVYGSTDVKAAIMRRYDGTGKLRSNETENGEILITGKDPTDIFCFPEIETKCFLAGDARVNHHATLSSLHIIFLREHNRIAEELKKLNPFWSEEILYQEARKINSAQLQCITYREYLPALLGPSVMNQFNLSVKAGSKGSEYNPEIRLGVANEFSASVFRLHNMIANEIGAMNLQFRNMYSNPGLIRQGHMKKVVKGICKVPSDKFGRLYAEDATDYLNQRPIHPFGKDLAAVDVKRGRDHGLAPYIYYVDFCSGGKIKIKSFDDLAPRLMSQHHVKILEEYFATVEDVDLWVGIQMENHLPDSELGPTTACLIAKQFYIAKFGDRFFFEHEGLPTSFTKDQLQSLKQCSLSRLLCHNSVSKKTQRNVMLLRSHENPKVHCDEIPSIDLSPWKVNTP